MIVEKRRLRARCSWPSNDNKGIYRTTKSEPNTATPSADYSYLGKENKVLWLVAEKQGDKPSMLRSSVFSNINMALALSDVLHAQGRRYIFARVDCSCGRCENNLLKSCAPNTNGVVYCPVVYVPLQDAREYADDLIRKREEEERKLAATSARRGS